MTYLLLERKSALDLRLNGMFECHGSNHIMVLLERKTALALRLNGMFEAHGSNHSMLAAACTSIEHANPGCSRRQRSPPLLPSVAGHMYICVLHLNTECDVWS